MKPIHVRIIFAWLLGLMLIGEYLYQSREGLSVIILALILWTGYNIAKISE